MNKAILSICLFFAMLLNSCASTFTSNEGKLVKKLSGNKGIFYHPGSETKIGDKLKLFIKECNPKRIKSLKSSRSSKRTGGRCWIEKLGECTVDSVDGMEVTISTTSDLISDFVWIDKAIPVEQ